MKGIGCYIFFKVYQYNKECLPMDTDYSLLICSGSLSQDHGILIVCYFIKTMCVPKKDPSQMHCKSWQLSFVQTECNFTQR